MAERRVRIRGVYREPVDIERLVRVLLLQVRRLQAEKQSLPAADEDAGEPQSKGAAS